VPARRTRRSAKFIRVGKRGDLVNDRLPQRTERHLERPPIRVISVAPQGLEIEALDRVAEVPDGPIRSLRFELVDPSLLGFGESAASHNAYQDAVALHLAVLDHERRTGS
jgi:hypothetical protein